MPERATEFRVQASFNDGPWITERAIDNAIDAVKFYHVCCSRHPDNNWRIVEVIEDVMADWEIDLLTGVKHE